MQLKFCYGMFARRCKLCPQCNDELKTFYKDIRVLCALRVLIAAPLNGHAPLGYPPWTALGLS